MQAIKHWQAFLDVVAEQPMDKAIHTLGRTLYTLRFSCEQTSVVIEAERALLRTADTLGVRAAIEEYHANGGE